MDSFVAAIVATSRAAKRSTQLQIIENLSKILDQILYEPTIGWPEIDYRRGRADLARQMRDGLDMAKAKVLEQDEDNEIVRCPKCNGILGAHAGDCAEVKRA